MCTLKTEYSESPSPAVDTVDQIPDFAIESFARFLLKRMQAENESEQAET